MQSESHILTEPELICDKLTPNAIESCGLTSPNFKCYLEIMNVPRTKKENNHPDLLAQSSNPSIHDGMGVY